MVVPSRNRIASTIPFGGERGGRNDFRVGKGLANAEYRVEFKGQYSVVLTSAATEREREGDGWKKGKRKAGRGSTETGHLTDDTCIYVRTPRGDSFPAFGYDATDKRTFRRRNGTVFIIIIRDGRGRNTRK